MSKLENKRSTVDGLRELLSGASSIVVGDHRGMRAVEMSNLYREGRRCGVRMRVVRSTLLLRALRDSPFSCVVPNLGGGNLVALSYGEAGTAARLLQDFSRRDDRLQVKTAALGGRVTSVDYLAALPTRVEALIVLLRLIREVVFMRLLRLLRLLAEEGGGLVDPSLRNGGS